MNWALIPYRSRLLDYWKECNRPRAAKVAAKVNMQAHRLREGCQMCGGSLIDEAANGTWTSKPDQRWVDVINGNEVASVMRGIEPNRKVVPIQVPVCGECYQTLATAESGNGVEL